MKSDTEYPMTLAQNILISPRLAVYFGCVVFFFAGFQLLKHTISIVNTTISPCLPRDTVPVCAAANCLFATGPESIASIESTTAPPPPFAM